MISSLPPFIRNTHFKELSPLDGSYKYRFLTENLVEITFKKPLLPVGKVLKCYDDNGRCWLTITHNTIIISKNYAWDGCTPKKWWGFWWGTPDFEKTIIASLVHDALLQFMTVENFPLNRYEIDNIFKDILSYNKFILTKVYYTGVRTNSIFFTNPTYKGYSTLTYEPKY